MGWVLCCVVLCYGVGGGVEGGRSVAQRDRGREGWAGGVGGSAALDDSSPPRLLTMPLHPPPLHTP